MPEVQGYYGKSMEKQMSETCSFCNVECDQGSHQGELLKEYHLLKRFAKLVLQYAPTYIGDCWENNLYLEVKKLVEEE